ncbi:sensor histidine kinase [Flavobacterium wongokense]|uniref:sensor histidine kinase n=1 Tax=Flavobacterium wongokense TaxID=2910674 RepID=UPI001F1E3F79|nr:GAF domain-containing sensor histidine kinase [Flavobacterium sp. WG47]MCF6132429.1 GAF domain-containing sensor histidine kinase [Flavobacterium sp. WG47]
MIEAKMPLNEARRLRILEEYQILDTENEADFDEITKLASEICESPISTITFINTARQWFKSYVGLPNREGPRNLSFCAHAINETEMFYIEDARTDERFYDSPLVLGDPNIVFYAGIPLIDKEGYALGTLCVIDTKTKKLTEFQEKALKTLAHQVMKLIELRKVNLKLQAKNEILKESYAELERFSQVVSHDIKSPLNNILGLTEMLKEEHCGVTNTEANLYIDLIKESSEKLKEYIDATLRAYKNGTLATDEKEFFYLNSVLKECIKMLNPKGEYEITLPENIEIFNFKSYFEQIFLNLIGNAIKYNDKEKVVINITVETRGDYYKIIVKDNGVGIPSDKLSKIFEMFYTLEQEDRFNNNGTGIGLSSVKSLVKRCDGEISVNSNLGFGSEFILKFNP